MNSKIDNRYSKLNESNKKIVIAQDRTINNIRAIARFLFIQLSSITLALGVGAFGAGHENEFLLFISVITYIVGVI